MERLGPYELIEELGRGGMGAVYRARRGERQVALKVMASGAWSDPELLARFRDEARALARLQHPGIVQVIDAGEDAGRAYLVMELLAGEPLGARLRRVQRLEPAEAARVGRRLAEALAHAHAAGVVHRDLKPDNVFLTDDGPVLVDFGLARLDVGALTATGDVLGSPAYMAPEQASGERGQVGPATDVYGLGAVLYRCLAGEPPFAGGLEAVLYAVLSRAPEPLSARAPQVPLGLVQVVERCLAKEPTERWASAGDLARALGPFGAASASIAPARSAPWGRLGWGLGAVALAVAAGALAARRGAESQALAPASSPTAPAPTPRASPTSPAAPTPRSSPPPPSPDVSPPLSLAQEDALEAARRLRWRGWTDRALEQVDAVLAEQPTATQALLLRGLVLAELERGSEARRTLQALIRLAAPEHPDVQLAQALLAVLERAPAAEIEGCLRRLSTHPQRSLVHDLELAFLWSERERPAEAGAALRSALAQAQVGDLELVADSAVMSRHLDLALEATERLTREAPDWAQGYVVRGSALSLTGAHDLALLEFDHAIELDPALPRAYLHRGIALLQLGDLEASEADFERAARLDAQDYLVQSNWGQLCLQRGRPAEALEHFRAARDRLPPGRHDFGHQLDREIWELEGRGE